MSNFKVPETTGKNSGTVYLGSIDNSALTVEAQYNPKELQVDKNIPWQKKNQANKSGATGIQLEFTGAEGRTMSLELLFDGYETKTSVEGPIKMLNEMASVIDPYSSKEDLRRPHLCLCTWGTTIPAFQCVIESLSAKYTMFSENGTPLRATCTVKLKEADAVSRATDSKDGAQGGT